MLHSGTGHSVDFSHGPKRGKTLIRKWLPSAACDQAKDGRRLGSCSATEMKCHALFMGLYMWGRGARIFAARRRTEVARESYFRSIDDHLILLKNSIVLWNDSWGSSGRQGKLIIWSWEWADILCMEFLITLISYNPPIHDLFLSPARFRYRVDEELNCFAQFASQNQWFCACR